MSTLSARLILTDHPPLPVQRPYEGVSWSVGFDAFFVGLSTLVDEEALAAVMYKCSSWKKNVVLTPDRLRGKNPIGRKSALNLYLLLCMYKCTIHLTWSSCACAWVKRNKGCLMHVLMSGNTLYAYKKMCNIKQYAMWEGVLMGSSKRNCSISNTWKRS